MKRSAVFLLAMALCGVFSAGCATKAMKGTPFYTGEYKKRLGDPADRVNMWPILYYRDPALSVLWPFMELSDEHFALRPVMSVHGLGEEKKIYNVLWPLGQINQKTGDSRFFPVFWGDDYCNVFPLYWHYGGTGTKVDSLFPAWVIFRNDGKYSYHFAWPVLNFKDWGEKKGWRVWPVAGSYKSYGKSYSFFAWPLGHAWSDGADAGSTLIPLYWYDRDGKQRSFVSLPYSYSRGGAREWDCGFPLFYREKSATGSSFISPLYLAGENGSSGSSWQCMVPLYYRSSKGDREIFGTLAGGWAKRGDSRGWAVVPALSWGTYSENKGSFVAGGILGHRSWDGENGSSHILPLYYSRREGGSRLFVSPLYSSGKSEQSSWRLVPPLYYGSENKKMETLVTPVYARGRALAGDAYWSALMPFYYLDGDKDSKRLITAAGAWSRRGDAKSWVLFPLLSGGKKYGNSGETWLAGPVYHRRWNEGGSVQHLFPVYYKDTRSGTFVSPLYSSWRANDGRTTHLIPPLLGSMTSGRNQNDLWALAGLVHASWGEGETPHHFLPFYYCDPSEGRLLSLLYCSREKDGSVSRVIPPLLSGYRRHGENRSLTMLAGLSSHQWGGGNNSGYTFPLYEYGRNHLFTPVVGWKKNDKSGFVYPLTPLIGIRTGEESGGWLFPLFSYRRDQADRISGTYLWGGFWKDERSSGSGIFPVYYYKNHGPIDRLSGGREGYAEAGKEFLSLPFCWYKNMVRTWPEYADGKRTDGTTRIAQKGNGFFPLWSYSSNEDLNKGLIDSSGSLLLWLFDSKYEKQPADSHEYVRKRVLWRLYHYERLNGDVSVDVFPFITYDRRTDGQKSFSFMWRFFSYQRKKEGVKVHVLFIPFGKGK